MLFLHFPAGFDDSQRRLDKVIRKFLPDMPLSAIYTYIRKSLIRINGKKTVISARVCEGDSIDIADFLLSTNPVKPEIKNTYQNIIKLPVLEDIFKNEFIRVINKPYDMSVQAGSSQHDSVSKIIQCNYEKTYRNNSLSFKPGPLHRLDRKTTGLLVCSENIEGARWFSDAMQKHIITKTYTAIVQGRLKTQYIWTDKIERSAEKKDGFHISKIANSNNPKGKIADTRAVPLAYGIYNGEEVTLVQFSIGSGRTHQIRLHSSMYGYPLLGDTAYGAHAISEVQNIYLHAWQMGVPEQNPIKMPPCLYAPISTNFQKMLKKCLLEWDYSAYNGKNI